MAHLTETIYRMVGILSDGRGGREVLSSGDCASPDIRSTYDG